MVLNLESFNEPEKKKKFKIIEIKPKLNRDYVIINLIII